jgi:uncharacterized protein
LHQPAEQLLDEACLMSPDECQPGTSPSMSLGGSGLLACCAFGKLAPSTGGQARGHQGMVKGILAIALALGVLATGIGTAAAQSPEAYREKVNQGTVAIISGGVNGTYIRIASDLAAVLDKPDELRILPIVGKGSVQNITDILYLRGIDVGIVQSDALGFIRKQNLHSNISQRIRYITKLYNEEVHILAGKDVGRLQDLARRPVNVDVAGSGTAMTAATLFDALGVAIEPTNFDQALALEKLKRGEIAAMVFVAGKPTELFRKIDAIDTLHFVPVPLTAELLDLYLPSSLGHADYPSLVAEGQPTATVAVGAVMAVFNWDQKNERYKRVGNFVNVFFDNFSEFLKPPRHPKWKEVNLAAMLPGWTRFQPAEEWLNARPTGSSAGRAAGTDTMLKNSFAEFIKFLDETGGRGSKAMSPQNREAMFARFIEWRDKQAAAPGAPPAPGSASPR